MKTDKGHVVPREMDSLLQGVYSRVALQLDVDVLDVSRAARGENRSRTIEAALAQELKRIYDLTAGSNGAHHNGAGKKRHSKSAAAL